MSFWQKDGSLITGYPSGGYTPTNSSFVPPGWRYESFPGRYSLINLTGAGTGVMMTTRLWLPAGVPLVKVGVQNGTSAGSVWAHQWACIMDPVHYCLATTTDLTNTTVVASAAGAPVMRVFTFTAATTFNYTGWYVFGLLDAATGVPNIMGITSSALSNSVGSEPLGGTLTLSATTGPPVVGQLVGPVFANGVTNGTATMTSATAAFTAADVGLPVWESGAAHIPANTYILSVTNGTTVVLSAIAATGNPVTFTIGRPFTPVANIIYALAA
jgi:hypothetical protein